MSCDSLLEALNAGVLVFDDAGRIRQANRRAEIILGSRPGALQSAEVGDVFAPVATLLAHPHGEVASAASGRMVGYSLSHVHDGGARPHHVCLFQDLSSVIALRRERDRLLQLAAVSSALPSMLHELRNPLSAIGGMIEVLLEECGDERLANDLHAMLCEVRRICLGLQGIGVVGHELRAREFHAVDHAMNEAARLLAPRAAKAMLELRTFVADMPLLYVDPGVMRAIVFNLITNAIEASRPGGVVELHAALDGDALVVSVIDNGSGMSPETQQRATELFFTTKRHGSGIGLPLVQRAVEVSGGTLSICSAEGRGTEITIRVPAATLPPAPPM